MCSMSDYHNIVEFTTRLRKIEGLHLLRIFSRYKTIIDIQVIFNCIAQSESEETLRELERLWEEFIQEKAVKEKNE